MGLFDHFPYTNVHELNLDWVLSMMKALEAEWYAFTAGNSLTFADPMLHDVTKTYAKNTIVLDGNGNAYVSLLAVPVGVGLQNGDCWLMVFDYEAFIEKVNKNFTARYYRGQYRATAAMAIGDWLTVDDVLCKATAAIAIDDVLEVGINIEHFTLEDFIKAFMQSANQLIQQYKNDIDASELAYRQQLAGDIQATTASLQAQLDAAIAGVTVDSEVINARIGWDNTAYSTLGDAIRGQTGDLNILVDAIYANINSWHEPKFNMIFSWENGYYQPDGTPQTGNWVRSKQTFYPQFKYVQFVIPNTYNLYLIDTTAQTSTQVYDGELKVLDLTHVYKFNSRIVGHGNIPYTDAELITFEGVKITFVNPLPVANEQIIIYNNLVLADANDAPYNSIYRIYSRGSQDATMIANLPYAGNTGGEIGFLLTIGENRSANFGYQLYITAEHMYMRQNLNNTWSAWKNYDTNKMLQYPTLIRDSNFSSLLPDFDNADDNTIYLCNFNPNTTPTHSPISENRYTQYTLSTYAVGSYKHQDIQYQGITYNRNCVNGVWTGWSSYDDRNPVTYRVSGSDSLVDAIVDALQYKNSTIYVSGSHDMYDEYKTAFPSDWDTRNSARGLVINNGITIIGETDCELYFDYDGNDPNVLTNMSIFDVRYGSATLKNLNMRASNIRYCIHNDMWTSSTYYECIIENCTFAIDNSLNSERSKWATCLGCGFGQHGLGIVKDCTFYGIGGDGNTYPAPDDPLLVYWHNGPNDHQQSKLIISGCYFINGTIGISNNGNATEETPCLISNNSFTQALVESYSGGYSAHNMIVLGFNNEVRP